MLTLSRRLWAASPPLIGASLLMLAVLAGNLVGLTVDSRLVGGAPAWLKPAKFAASTAAYMLTLAWTFSHVHGWPRLKGGIGRGTAVILVLEVALINLQAARGVISHFNVATSIDGAIYSAMGLMILVAWGLSIALLVPLFRHPFPDAALGRAIRLGVLLSVVGAGLGGVMTRPTNAQIAAVRQGATPTVFGAHTVGAPDGEQGLPLTAWSREHGDLRVPHFLGLHAIQILPMVALALQRVVRNPDARTRGVSVVAASLASLMVILLRQALAGEALLAPGATTRLALLAWGIATIASLGWVLSRRNAIGGSASRRSAVSLT